MKQVGRYEIIEELGQGAMGAVYKARDPMMDRVVAVKTILASALTGPLAADYRERFFREARAAGRLAHPGIVTVYDVSEQEGTPFLVMELIEGRTLEKILESGERFDTKRVMELGQQLAEALDYAHKGGVIHWDIKPANIMVTADGRPKITDFGVAKLTAAQVTTTGQLLGTPAFMAPEQFTGSPLDGRADLFALGVMLYWLATGDRPFTGETLMAMSYKIVHTEPVPPRKINPAIPRDLENVIMKCMEKDPAERYQNGEALARDLRTMREGRALDTLNRERMGRSIDKTALAAAPQPPEADVVEDSMDSAETVAVLQPRPRAGSGSAAGIRAGVAAPRGTMAAPQGTVSSAATEAEHAKRRMWLLIAAIVIVALLAAAVLKKRAPEVPPQDQAQQQAQPTPQPGSNAANVQALPPPVQVPAPPMGLGEPPEVRKARADAEKAAEESRKESAALTAKHPRRVTTGIHRHGARHARAHARCRAGSLLPDAAGKQRDRKSRRRDETFHRQCPRNPMEKERQNAAGAGRRPHASESAHHRGWSRDPVGGECGPCQEAGQSAGANEVHGGKNGRPRFRERRARTAAGTESQFCAAKN